MFYKYTGNRRKGERTGRIVLEHNWNGEPSRYLDLNGDPQELTEEQFIHYNENHVLEPVSEDELPLPEGVPAGYRDMKVAEIKAFLDEASPDVREAVIAFEQANEDRVSIARHIVKIEATEQEEREAAGDPQQDLLPPVSLSPAEAVGESTEQ